MNDKRRVTVSKYLSKHLRHAPQAIGLTLEPGGWVAVSDLLAATLRHGFPVLRDELEEVVAKCDKQRLSFDESGLRIRANQGHSTEVDLQLDAKTPPDSLFHGTGAQNQTAILASGLRKMSRHHVHLSADLDTARRVGSRHGKPLVFTVASATMAAAGFAFYQSENGVWLTDHVPPEYLRVMEATDGTPPPDAAGR